MRKTILKKAKFDIMDLNSIKVAQCCFVPVLLGHAIDDDFIQPHHSDRIYDSYVGDKNIIKFDGDHNSPRPQFYFDSITIFFHNVLNPPKDVLDANHLPNIHNYFHKDKWDITHEEEFTDLTSSDPSQELTSSTEDDINRIRSKRPMCRTEVPADVRMQEKQSGLGENGSDHDLGSSSSRLITFDFSHGHSSSPLTPTIIDDQFVEYSFDGSADFPSNLEEEEQMFMEAVLESLKDLAVRHPQDEDQPSQSTSTNPNSSHEDGLDACTGHCTRPIETSNGGESDIKHPSTESKTFDAPAFDPPKMLAKSVSTSSTNADASTTTQSSSDGDSCSQDVDGTGGTRARLTVERNPASHVMDGLMHRWRLNFFRNNG